MPQGDPFFGSLVIMIGYFVSTFVGGMVIGFRMLSEPMMKKKHYIVGGICIFICGFGGTFCCAVSAWPVALLCQILMNMLPDITPADFDYLEHDPSILALKERQRRGELKAATADNAEPAPADPSKQPYRLIGTVVFCNNCDTTTSREKDGSIPKMCPSCGYPFGDGRKKADPPKTNEPKPMRSEEPAKTLRIDPAPKPEQTRDESPRGKGFTRKDAFKARQDPGDDIVSLERIDPE